MRELSETEMGAIAGGYSPNQLVWVPPSRPAWVMERYFQRKPVNPLTGPFGTSTGPVLVLPGDPPGGYL